MKKILDFCKKNFVKISYCLVVIVVFIIIAIVTRKLFVFLFGVFVAGGGVVSGTIIDKIEKDKKNDKKIINNSTYDDYDDNGVSRPRKRKRVKRVNE
jgi:uncharacterized membrane protein